MDPTKMLNLHVGLHTQLISPQGVSHASLVPYSHKMAGLILTQLGHQLVSSGRLG